MDYAAFLEQLPLLDDNWGGADVCPKSDRFQSILTQTEATVSATLLQALNAAVAAMEPEAVYCEIGCQGATFAGALLDHPERSAYAVNDFSAVSPEPSQRFTVFMEVLSAFNLEEQVLVCDQPFEEFFADLRSAETVDRIGVYFYNSAPDYRAQLMALLLVTPFLAEQALILLGNSATSAVQQASCDFRASHPQCRLLLEWESVTILHWDAATHQGDDWETLSRSRDHLLINFLADSGREFEIQRHRLETLYAEALTLHQAGYLPEARQMYQELLRWDGRNSEAWRGLGLIDHASGQLEAAYESLLKAVRYDGSQAVQHYSFGLVLEDLGRMTEAAWAYEQAIVLDPTYIQAYNNLGNLLLERRAMQEAEQVYRAAITACPEHFGGHLNLGNLLMTQNYVEQAIEAYTTALHLDPRNPDILHNLAAAHAAQNDPAQAALYYGDDCYQRGDYTAALGHYQIAIALQPSEDAYIGWAESHNCLKEREQAIEVYRESVRVLPQLPKLHLYLALALQEYGLTEEAIATATEALQHFPTDLGLQLVAWLSLPIIYQTQAEISVYRQRFITGLSRIVEGLVLETSEQKQQALAGLDRHTNFYLSYQGLPDRDLYVEYGQFVHRIMAANYPQCVEPLRMPPLTADRRIRVGYFSFHLENHNGARWALGWLQHHDRQSFNIHCYHAGRTGDRVTQQFQRYSDRFYHMPHDWEKLCEQVLADQLHVLVFPDIGMTPHMGTIAALRLAPVQCTAWGHPVTSGSPTVDYYLSSELMEPETGQDHYSERLVRLPNLGFSYPKPILPDTPKTRADFQIAETAIVYLCCQSLYKYLPQYDFVWVEIAQRVPHAQFVFLTQATTQVIAQFRQRVHQAFSTANLDSDAHCIFLPPQNHSNYLSLNLLSDVFLDSFDWTGGNSTLEAIGCNLPIVTCPSEFMRGRHSYGILHRLGVTETIAKDPQDYIELAVKLAQNPAWRQSIIKRMQHRLGDLYDDRVCVQGLEAFYRQVVENGG